MTNGADEEVEEGEGEEEEDEEDHPAQNLIAHPVEKRRAKEEKPEVEKWKIVFSRQVALES